MSKQLNRIRQVFFGTTLLVAAFPVWPLKWAVYFIIVWILCAAAVIILDPDKQWKKNAPFLILFSSIFFIHLTFYFLTDPPSGSYHYIERRLSILIFPLGFYFNFNGFNENQLKQILRVFEVSAFLVVIYITYDVVPLIYKHWDNIQAGTGFNWLFRQRVENITNIHPTYLSIILLFSIFLKLERMVKREIMSSSLIHLLAESLQVILMLTCCLLLSARGPLISFAFALLIYFFQMNWKRTIIGMALGLPVVVILFSSVPAISSRFQEITEIGKPKVEGEALNSMRIRQGIFNCTIDVLKQNWVMGVGLGNVQEELNACYRRLNEPSFLEMEYNTHNQFLHIWISAGLIGILIFVLSLISPLYLAYKQGDSTYLFFIILFSCCFLTENLLARQHGVVMYTFFNALLAFNHIHKRD